MSPTAPSSPPLSPRQRLVSLFSGSSGRPGSPAQSPPIPGLTTDTHQELSRPSTTPDQLLRTRSHRLSRLTAPLIKTAAGGLAVGSPPKRASATSPPRTTITPLDLASIGSPLNDGKVETGQQVAHKSVASASRPTSPSKAPFFRNSKSDHSSQPSTPPLLVSPPLSPTKRAGVFLFNRSRKASLVSTGNDGRVSENMHGTSTSTSPSRSASPTKQGAFIERSPSPPKRRSVEKSMIGLPTNFKHTSGGSSALSHNAIQLAGLAAVEEQNRDIHSGTQGDSRFPRSEGRETGAIVTPRPGQTSQEAIALADKSLANSLLQIQAALTGNDVIHTDLISLPAPQPPMTRQGSQSPPSSYTHDGVNRMDTVKEVPSGFIQRFENAGQSPNVRRGGGSDLLSDNQLPPDMVCRAAVAAALVRPEDTLAPTTGRLSPPPSRSPPGSPTKMSRRKAVPKLKLDEEEDCPAVTQDQSSQQASEKYAVGSQGADETLLPKSPSCASIKSQEWSITLAEISAALKV